jgi:FHA domain
MNYWCDEKLVVHIVGPEGEREVVVEQPYAQVGAHSQSQVVLSGPGVGKRALLLLATEHGIYVLNLDMEDATLEERGRWLNDTDSLLVGPYRLTVRAASGQSPRQQVPDLVAVKSRLPIPVVHVYCDRLLKDRRRFRHPLSIVGRRPQCSLQLRGLEVSSFHCAMFWHNQRLWCIDLLSSNGTRLNGEPLVCGELRLNDRLEVGEFGLLYYRWSPRRSTPGMTPEQADDDPRRIDAPPPKPEPAIDAHASPPALPHLAAAGEPPDALVLDIAALEQTLEDEQQHLRQTVSAKLAQLAADRLAIQAQALAATEELKRRTHEVEQDAVRLAEERRALDTARHDLQQEHQTMIQQLADRDTQLSLLKLDLAAAHERLAARQAEPAAEPLLHSAVAAERAHLAAERLAFQQQSLAATEQLNRRLQEVQEDAARLAAERRALEETRIQWKQERDALMHQLADRAAQLSRAEMDLSAANDLRGTRIAGHPEGATVFPESSRPTLAPHMERWHTDPTVPAAFAASVSDTQIEFSGHSEVNGQSVVRGSPDLSVVRGSLDPAPARRERGELTSFVSGRLGDIERTRLRQTFLLWTAIACGALALGVMAFGIWSWLL